MSPSKLGIYANLVLTASAVLIPPTMTAEDLGDDNNALKTLAINPLRRLVALECPGCASATLDGESLKWKADAGNAFLLDFGVGTGEVSLELDGYQLYPPSFSYSTQPFYVTQLDPTSEESLHLRVTGYEFRYNGAETISEAGTELLPMTFQITSVEGTTVNPPALNINVLKDAEGRLMIASLQAAQPNEATPTDQDKDCKEWPLLCKWKSILADRIDKMKKMGKGCHGRPHGNPMKQETTHGKPPHISRPGKPHHHPHHGPHHMGHEGHRHHHFHVFVRRAFFTILIPILIGIFAGTLTYLIGMALGCLIAITVAKIRGQRYQRIALEEDVEEPEEDVEGPEEDVEKPGERGEKEEYAELPAYEAPPVYEEAAVKEVDE